MTIHEHNTIIVSSLYSNPVSVNNETIIFTIFYQFWGTCFRIDRKLWRHISSVLSAWWQFEIFMCVTITKESHWLNIFSYNYVTYTIIWGSIVKHVTHLIIQLSKNSKCLKAILILACPNRFSWKMDIKEPVRKYTRIWGE